MEKDLISVFYIFDSEKQKAQDQAGKSDSGPWLGHMSKENGFGLVLCGENEENKRSSELNRFDMILVEEGSEKRAGFEKEVKNFKNSAPGEKPAVFMVCSRYPALEKRAEYVEKGYDDFLLPPFTAEEIKSKFRVFGSLKLNSQKLAVNEAKLEKSFEYLDKFKVELTEIKKQLYEERTALNSALKQISQLTQERSKTKKEILKLKKQLKNNTQGFFEILSSLITSRIEKNRGHGQRVAEIACFIGKQAGLDEKKLAALRKAAILHETGLLLIPDTILEKREKSLTGFEKDFFIQYPLKGGDLISNCSELGRFADIIRHLNENSDGTGSPKGLKRRYIPLESRILAGADEFDTIRDETESLKVLLEKLEQLSGTRLDPNIVDLLEKYAVTQLENDAYRVKGIGVHQLEPGMTLGTALYTNTGTKLFSVNTLLTLEAVDKIKKYNREYPVDETIYIRV